MARPKSPAEQQIRAYQLFQTEGFSAIAILTNLELEYDTPVSLRTVYNWLKVFKNARDEFTQYDEEFAWHKLSQFDLPWESSEFILAMWKYVTRYSRLANSAWVLEETQNADGRPKLTYRLDVDLLSEDEPMPPPPMKLPPPTFRQAKWWWRIHLAVPDVEFEDLYWLSQRFVDRELAQTVLGIPATYADLEAHLAYQPWHCEDCLEIYLTAVQEQQIPQISQETFSTSEREAIASSLDWQPLTLTETWSAPFNIMLWSQILERLRQGWPSGS